MEVGCGLTARAAGRNDKDTVIHGNPETIMTQGDKSAYTDKQKHKAEKIEQSYESRGVGEKEAERRAWATVNKQDGGGKLSGSGRAHSGHKKSAHK